MAKFVANKIDLDLELTTLSGDEFKIAGPVSINAEQAVKIATKMDEQERDLLREPSTEKAIAMTCAFLVDVYGKDKTFWEGNFPPETLFAIRKWFIDQLAGVKKKD